MPGDDRSLELEPLPTAKERGTEVAVPLDALAHDRRRERGRIEAVVDLVPGERRGHGCGPPGRIEYGATTCWPWPFIFASTFAWRAPTRFSVPPITRAKSLASS